MKLPFLLVLATFLLSVGNSPTAGAASRAALDGKTGNPDYDKAVQNFRRKIAVKIVGGHEVSDDTTYPWQVSLEASWVPDHTGAHFCGGTLYNDHWVVTAAHCVRNLTKDDIKVVLGTHTLTADGSQIGVKLITSQPAYSYATNDNDVAVLELATPVSYSDRVKPLPLLSVENEKTLAPGASQLTVTGWGATTEGGKVVSTLRYVELDLVDRQQCNQPLSYNGAITDNMICAGERGGGRDSCQGDSGGPLLALVSGSPYLAGIVSWGDGCARPLKYGVYARVTPYLKWISDNTK